MNDGQDSGADRAWRLLLARAQRKVEAARADLSRSRVELERVLDRRQRLSTLLDEYTRSQERAQSAVHALGDTLNSRRFIGQLLQLGGRVDSQVDEARAECEARRRALVEAEAEASKYAKLLEREIAAQRANAARRELREIEAWNISQHSRRETH